MSLCSKSNRISGEVPFSINLISIIVVAFILQVISINTFPLNFDEALYVLIARFIEHGYRPYTEIFVSQLPLFVAALSGIWNITGGSIFFSKVIFIGLNTIFLISLGYLGLKLFSQKEALFSVVLLAISTPFIAASLAIAPDLLSTTFACVAILFMSMYTENAERKWLVLSGCFLAIAVLIDFSIAYMVLVLLILLSTRHSPIFRWDHRYIRLRSSWKNFFLDIILLLAGCFGISLVVLFVFDLRVGYEFVINFRSIVREVVPLSIQDNLHKLLVFSVDNGVLFLGMLLGIYFAYDDPRHVIWFLFVWYLIAVLWLVPQVTLQVGQVTSPWIPMTLMASWGFVQLGSRLVDIARAHWRSSVFSRVGTGLVLGIFLAIYALFSLRQTTELVNRAWQIEDEDDFIRFQAMPKVVTFVRDIALPDDCVVSDDPFFLLEADRLPPPILSEISEDRIASGYLSPELIETVIVVNGCKAIISVNHTFQAMPDLWGWAKKFYSHYVNYGGIEIYFDGS
jgi:hypothetical protein